MGTASGGNYQKGQKRLGMKRLRRFFFVSALVAAIHLGVLLARWDRPDRITIAVASAPAAVWSWDRVHNTFIVVTIPADYIIQGAGGYGAYAIESLWKLGFIDEKSGVLFSRSLEQLLAIPIPWYIGSSSDALMLSPDAVVSGRRLFSLGQLIPFLIGSWKTNITLVEFAAFSWHLGRARLDAISLEDLARMPVADTQEKSDGSIRSHIAPEKVDLVLKGRFEDLLVRSESVSVAVYNTTATPALGTQAARMLANAGILVVFVDNAEGQVEACVMKGSSVTLQTVTAKKVRELFSCTTVVKEEEERADLEIYLGAHYAKQFTGI